MNKIKDENKECDDITEMNKEKNEQLLSLKGRIRVMVRIRPPETREDNNNIIKDFKKN